MGDPTLQATDVDGSSWGEIHRWDDMDWSCAEWRETSIWGDDPHWRVPHKNGETFHRVRMKEKS